ncbi:MAG: glycosyltransferase family 39 protein [Candidatus Pacearchaeota archaeon]
MKTEFKSFIIIAIIYLLLVFIVPPDGEFPINDDWAYASNVKYYLDTGNIKITNSIIVNILQIFWGSLFSKFFGFSFTTLRISTIILSFIGTITMYLILRELKFSNKMCIFGALLLLFNPLYFHHTYTFMSEVPFLSLFLLSMLFYIKSIKKDNTFYLFFGSLFAIFSFLVRQHGIIIPIATAIYVFFNRREYKLTKEKIFILIIFPILAAFIFQYWYLFIHGQTIKNQYAMKMLFSRNILLRPFYHSFFNLLFIGLYLSPFILLIFYIKKFFLNKNSKYLLWIASFMLSLFFLFHFSILKSLPSHFFHSMINRYGLLGITHIIDNSPDNPLHIFAITVLSIISATLILLLVYNEFYIRKRERSPTIFVYFIGLSYFISLAILPGVFDRYILPLIPIILVLLLSSIERVRELPFFSAILGIILVIFAIFSVVGTYDFLNYNRTLWTALNKLIESGISPEDIDGGSEFNCWFLYDYCLKKFGNIDPIYPGNKNITQRMCVVNNDYVISLSELPGYFILDKLKYFSHMGNTYIDIYVLKKVN